MITVSSTESGTASSEIRARIQLIESIMMSTPTMVSTAVMSCVRLCCNDCEMLSMSLVTRLSTSPRGMIVEVAQRQAGELLVRRLPQPVDRALRDARHDVLLHPGEDGAQHIDGDEQEQGPLERREVDPLARVDGHAGEHVGLRVLALGPERGDGLLLGHAGGDLLCSRRRRRGCWWRRRGSWGP